MHKAFASGQTTISSRRIRARERRAWRRPSRHGFLPIGARFSAGPPINFSLVKIIIEYLHAPDARIQLAEYTAR
jgi:hypothetical protein